MNLVNEDTRVAADAICATMDAMQQLVDDIDSGLVTMRQVRNRMHKLIIGKLSTARIHTELAGAIGPATKRRPPT